MYDREEYHNLARCSNKSLSNDNPLTPESLIEKLKECKSKVSAII